MRLLAWILAGLGGFLILLVIGWFGYGLYVRYVVASSPATISVIRTGNGEQKLGIYRQGNQVVQATTRGVATPAATPAGAGASAPPIVTPSAPLATATPAVGPSRPVLPPTHLRIPSIGVDVPVVLADNADLPRFRGAGWYMGSGFPGFRGNMVLVGHLNGIYETFGRLYELKPGDLVLVQAVNRTYRYKVSRREVVPEADVAVLAPTHDYRITLMTCTGTFFPLTRDYSDRLVVVGSLEDR